MKTLEKRVELIEKTLKLLQKYVSASCDVMESDTVLFNKIEERLKCLEEAVE